MKKLLVAAMVLLLSSCIITGKRYELLNGSLSQTGVSAKVRIIYDSNGVPHILGSTDTDVYYGLGYAMAQDRFFFMDFARRLGRGELSALFGRLPHYKTYDLMTANRVMRSLGFAERAQKGVAALDPQSLALLSAYTRGVNRYLKEAGDKFPEYHALKVTPQPWTVEDCFVVADISGFVMTSYSFSYEYYATRLVRQIGPEKAQLFMVDYPKDAPYINMYNTPAPANARALEDFFSALSVLAPVLPNIGSNSWVVDGSMSASGKPILSNDPHVPVLFAPTYWYHVHLKGGSFDMAGMMFSGFPVFAAGSNGKVSWGLTNARGDYIDLFREKLNPQNPNQYFYKGEWRNFETVHDKIPVAHRESIKFNYRKSVHGTIIEKAAGYTNPKVAGEVLSLHITDVDLPTFFRGYVNMARATDAASFRAAVKDMAMGPFCWNHVWAAIDGQIGYLYSGHIALRPDKQGILARSGAGDDEWGDWLPFEKLPHFSNPARHYIVTANNKIEPPDYPYYLCAGYMYPSRAIRIDEMLKGRTGLRPEDMAKIQGDLKIESGSRFVPILIADLESSSEPDLQLAASLLKEWQGQDYFATTDTRGTGVYKLIMKEMMKQTFSDELGPKLVANMGLADMTMPALWKILPDPDNIWFDNIKTPQRETRKDITQAAARVSIKYLRKHLGKDPANWKWGNLQKLYIRTPMGFLPWNKKYGLGPYPRGGDEETVNNSAGLFIGFLGFISVSGGTTRLTVDMADPKHLYFNATTGNSENPDSPFFANTTKNWLEGSYKVISLDEDDFSREPLSELQIWP